MQQQFSSKRGFPAKAVSSINLQQSQRGFSCKSSFPQFNLLQHQSIKLQIEPNTLHKKLKQALPALPEDPHASNKDITSRPSSTDMTSSLTDGHAK